jgi:hypothetical protein
MTIKAILRNGVIQPLGPLPADWSDGEEPVVEQPELTHDRARLDAWSRELEASVAQLPEDEHRRFSQALLEIERESKEAVRRQWSVP